MDEVLKAKLASAKATLERYGYTYEVAGVKEAEKLISSLISARDDLMMQLRDQAGTIALARSETFGARLRKLFPI